MDTVLLDTDVFSYLLKGHRRGDPYKRHVDGKAIAISVVTIGELYSGATKNEWGPAKLQNLESRLRTAVIISLDLDVCHAYATIRNQKSSTGSHRVVETNDAWIAACAVRHALPLVSNNRRHFDWIPGLTLICEAPALMSPTSGLLPLSRTAKDTSISPVVALLTAPRRIAECSRCHCCHATTSQKLRRPSQRAAH